LFFFPAFLAVFGEQKLWAVFWPYLFRIPHWTVFAQTEFLGTMAEEGTFHQAE